MSPLISRPSTPHPDGRDTASPSADTARPWRRAGLRLLGGVIAAALGLGACTVVVLLLWIGSPQPQSDSSGALHVAAALWLAAHGADLVRAGTVTGEPVPVGITPLLLVALPVWLLSRAVRGTLEEHRPPTGRQTVRAAATVAVGYLLAAAAVIAYAAEGPLRVEPGWAALRVGLLAVLVSGAAVWFFLGRPAPRLPHELGPVCGLALRAAGWGTAMIVAGGLLLTVLTVAWHGGEAAAGLGRLSGSWAGHVGVGLLTLALLPNAAIWAAAYGLGPGFTLGGGAVMAPLAGFPAGGVWDGGPPGWVAGAVPLAAALGLGWRVGRSAAPVAAPVPRGGAGEDTLEPRDAALAAALGACGCGLALGALAASAGGALGTEALTHVGPAWFATGAAALTWTIVVGVPTALAVRAWRLRERGARAERAARVAPGPGDWHETGARRTRWAALKEASGGLMADFPPRTRD